jgi:PPK2 family polyphosphate:nucleotide phosphotransferase
MFNSKIIDAVRVKPGTKVRLGDFETGYRFADELKDYDKSDLKQKSVEVLEQNLAELASMQELLYASNTYSLLLILQGMDASGKDGIIKHVMSGVNPQGCQVTSFKQPSTEELNHDFLWRCAKVLPERGKIGIFNRSYYEEVLVAKVHPAILGKQRLPDGIRDEAFWQQRYDDINTFEKHLVSNGTRIIKYYLHISKQEQKTRFLSRLEKNEKHWKFSADDIAERKFWDEYASAYEEAISRTSSEWAPWFIIPSDFKWVARTLIADIIVSTIKSFNLSYPHLTTEQEKALAKAKEELENEK